MTQSYSLAFLSGGSSGIGLAFAEELIRRNCSVILAARGTANLESARYRLEEIRRECRQTRRFSDKETVRIITLALDVSDSAAVKKELERILEDAGVPDLLYCGAGIAYTNHFDQISFERYRSIMDTNVEGIWNVLSVFVPAMKLAGGGRIITVSSMAGLVGSYGYTAYGASKFAVVGMSQCLRNELQVDGIKVQVLCPPDTNTAQLVEENITKPEETRKINGALGCLEPRDVARVLIRALERRRFIIIPGLMSKAIWYLYRLFPGLVHRIIDADVKTVRKSLQGKKPG